MNTSRQIKFYKGVILVKYHEKVVADGAFLSIDECDELLKGLWDIDSVSNLSFEEMKDFIEHCKFQCAQIGLDIKDLEEL